MDIDCLVLGHYETSLNDLARRLSPSRNDSGGMLEVETNSIRTTDGYLAYPDLFAELARRTYCTEVRPTPFRSPHAGAIYLANRLDEAGIPSAVVNYVSPSMDELVAAFDVYKPKVVAVTTTYYVEESPVIALIRRVRQLCESALIVVGGPLIVSRTNGSANSGIGFLSRLQADAYITDPQGEETLLALVDQSTDPKRNFSKIPNLYLRRSDGQLASTETRREANDLDSHRVRWRNFASVLVPKMAFVRSARGCAFHCAFCNYPAMSGGHQVSSVDATCNELEELASLGVRDVAFVDDTFNVPLPRFKSLLKEIIRRRIDMRWTSFFRCSNADDEAFNLMAESGCCAVFLGIESGDADILKLMQKSAKPAAYARGIERLTSAGILTMGSFIIGFPGETASTAQRTLDFIAENPTTFYNLQLYYHDALAPVESRRMELQIEGGKYSWSHPGMDWREAADWVRHGMSIDLPSTPMPLYGFSIWSLPYLQALGMPKCDFISFTSLAGKALRAGLRSPVDLTTLESEFRATIRPAFMEKLETLTQKKLTAKA